MWSQCNKILIDVGFHLDLQVEWNSAFELGVKKSFPTDGAKLVMLESSVKMIVQRGVVHSQPDPEKMDGERDESSNSV